MPILEIERKFIPHPSLLGRFHRNQGSPPFRKLEHLGNQKIHDIYFDVRIGAHEKHDILARNGIWVRKRNGTWEAKQRVLTPPTTYSQTVDIGIPRNDNDNDNNPFLRTMFRELICRREIEELVNRYAPPPPSSTSAQEENFGLQPIADFVTSRKSYLVDNWFHVVLDQMCFGHRVGEVEVLADPAQAEQAQRDIDAFMEKYRWFFLAGGDGGGKVKGKLTAWMEKYPNKVWS